MHHHDNSADPTARVPKDAESSRDKFYHLRAWHQAVQELLDASAFGWDSKMDVVTAEEWVRNQYSR